jgi:hypothetical protein
MRAKQRLNTLFHALLGGLFLLFATTPSAPAAKTPELKFRKVVDLPNINLRIKLMLDCTENPLPPPTVYRFTRRSADTQQVFEMYSPIELWRHSQQAGKWGDKEGNVLLIATVTIPPPKDLITQKFVSKDDYDKKIEENKTRKIDWNQESLAEWIAFFAGVKSPKLQSIQKHASTLQDLVSVELEGYPSYSTAYAFRLNRVATGQMKAPETWFFVEIEMNPAADLNRSRKAIVDEFLQNISVAKTASAVDTEPSKTFQNREAMKTGGKSSEFIASRKQAADSIINMKDWWFVETENYIILSDMKSKYRVMVKDLQSNIEFLRSAYEKALPPRAEIKAVSVVRVFGTPEEYDSYVPNSRRSSIGIWMPNKKELVIKPVEWGNNADQKSRVFSVTYHEAFHQYVHYAMGEIETSVWFNEGYASFFEGATIRDNKLLIQENEQRSRALENIVKSGSVDLQYLVNMTYEEFYDEVDHNSRIVEENYTLAWALVYYLSKGIAIEPQSPYAGVLGKYADALWTTKNPKAATKAAFEGIDMAALDKDFVKFWKSSNKRSAALRNRIPCEGR